MLGFSIYLFIFFLHFYLSDGDVIIAASRCASGSYVYSGAATERREEEEEDEGWSPRISLGGGER